MYAKTMLVVLLMLAATPGRASDSLDANRLMAELVWQKRVLLLFAPSPEHASLQRQGDILTAADSGMRERDMAVIVALASNLVSIDGDERNQSADSFYRRFDVDPAQFRAILVGKDGSVKLESNEVVYVDELFALIDSMPMRRREMSQDG